MIIKPVADLYLITYEDGRLYKHTRDAEEASDAISFGFEVEEFVSLEKYRAAMLPGAEKTEPLHAVKASPLLNSSAKGVELQHADCQGEYDGNSPVIPDGWVACSPEWIERNGPCSCSDAPRIAFGSIGNHYHPYIFHNPKREVKSWPSTATYLP